MKRLASLCILAMLTLPAKAETPAEPSGYSAYQLSIVTKLDPRDRTRENGVRLARMSLGENTRPLRPRRCAADGTCPKGVSLRKDGTAGEPTQDHSVVLQTVENKRQELERLWKRPVRLREAMRAMAPHLVGDRVLKRDRQVWIRGLPSRGRALPRGYPDAALWKERHSRNWERFRAWAIQQVTVGYFPICEGTPVAYGSQIDWPLAVSRGLCIIDGCGDRITAWARPGNGCELTDERTAKAYAAVEKMRRRRAKYLANRQGVTVVDVP
jgi:hypothetical protein